VTGATVTARALIRRVNRKLKPLNKTIRQTRGKYLAANHGEFYLQDCPTFGEPSNIRYVNLPDLETMARELGALADGETVNA
jgi:hypothetical protein